MSQKTKKLDQPKQITLESIWKQITTQYQIIDILGQGSYGKVVKAIDHYNNKVVAIKLV